MLILYSAVNCIRSFTAHRQMYATLYGWHIECFYLKIRQEIQIKSILLNMGWLCVCACVAKDDPSVHIFPMYILLFSQFYDLCLHIFTYRSFLSFLPLLDFDIRSTITQSKHIYILVYMYISHIQTNCKWNNNPNKKIIQ